MYTISVPNAVLTSPTLAGLFPLFQDDRVREVDTCFIRLAGTEAGERITRYNGALALRMPGTARSIVNEALHEIRRAGSFVRPDGSHCEPWEIRASDWDGLFEFVELCRNPNLLLSSDQIEAATAEARAAGKHFVLSDICIETMERLFGFGYCGPQIAGTREVHSRHSLHVAHALLANLPVPETVLDTYRNDAEAFRYSEWAEVLVKVPSLRGAIPGAKLRTITSVMRHNGKPIDEQNADILTMLARLLPDEPTYPHVEDVLHAHGLIDDLPLPDTFSKPVDVGQPVSPLASRVRELVAASVCRRAVEFADKELKAGRISHRMHRHRCNIARLDEGRHTFEYGNRMARALAERNVESLLKVLDTSDEHNRASKTAFEEVLGVKLLRLRPAARHRAVFLLCGYNEAQQAQWESLAAQRRAESEAERGLQDAREAATQARYKDTEDAVITGVEHVDRAIREGYSTIRSYPRGASVRYVLARGEERTARRLSAKDGTLAYARAVLGTLAS
ncbi:hypothetical protein M3A49_39700 [Paraburkholderia sp. CNPSo 3076]|uniref:hypothetical protein n=1 Tax=Paraburkholderia sp. CNPSo 3076 TaxID=2940936 RepID=UPI0022562F25|nr:hypothetical protein [Paraburkholderia sp. CNPSo 3076]MCX5545485.1 hypothetical protein [Paraburkholderia sp. CNPSo 3076]